MTNLDHYFDTIQQKGKVINRRQTERWSTAVLKTLGLNMSKKAKKQLAKALPPELAADLTRVFWLAHFRNTSLPAGEFQTMVARRAGHTDPQYARMAITAVFHALKQLIDPSVSDAVADGLSPELRDLWQNA